MKASADWESVPEGMISVWEGLLLDRVEQQNMEHEIEIAQAQRKKINVALILLFSIHFFFGLFSKFWLPNALPYILLSGVVFVVVLAVPISITNRTEKRLGPIAVFKGMCFVAVPGSRLGRLLKKLDLLGKEVEVKLNGANEIIEVNGVPKQVKAGSHLTTIIAADRDSSSTKLTRNEIRELQMRLDKMRTHRWSYIHMLLVPVIHSLMRVIRGREDMSHFFVISLVIGSVYVAYYVYHRIQHNRLQKDIDEGELISVEDRLILKHSRKDWLVDGLVADWRVSE